jgi:hypothetical protein
MPVTGLYMARRVHHSSILYVGAYGQCALRNVFPVFADLSQRAEEVASAEYQRLGSQLVAEDCDGNMSDLAATAREKGQAFYDTMFAMSHTTLNLFSAGLFHLLEQQLADLCRDGAFEAPPPIDTKLCLIARWYHTNFNLDLRTLPAWPKINQLRLLANVVKHGEGGSAIELRKLRPDLFENPRQSELLPDFPQTYTQQSLRLPMAGEDLYVTEEVFTEYSEAANRFISEIAEYFTAHCDNHFLMGG